MADKKKRRSALTHIGLAARAGRTALSQQLSNIGLYPGQDAVLLVLCDHDGIALRDLAERLSVRPPTITKTVARLVGQGLIEKRPSQNDARQSHAYLTARGHALVEEVRAAQKTVERSALKGLSDKERKALRKLLQRVLRNLDTAAVAPTGLVADE